MQSLINVLIRTHKRPELFLRCLNSVFAQGYENLRIVVSTDCECDYIPNGIEVIKVAPKPELEYGYDCYCNDLKAMINDGWFMYLDDDDYLLPNALNEVELNAPVIIHKLNHMGNIIPKKNEVALGQIGMPCFMIHHSLKDVAHFAGEDHGDYWFAKELSKHVGFVYRDLVLVESDRKGYGL